LLTGAGHIYMLSYGKGIYRHGIAFFYLGVLDAKLTQKAQRRQVVALEMPQLTTSETFWFGLIETHLHCRITIFFRQADLGNIAWPSFDEGDHFGASLAIENLGRPIFLPISPFIISIFSYV
jgi:hypothetical protein